METGIFTSNRNAGFGKPRWRKAICAECGESGAKPKAERALCRKKYLCLITCLPLMRSNEADWSPILRTTIFSCRTTFKVSSCHAGAQILLFSYLLFSCNQSCPSQCRVTSYNALPDLSLVTFIQLMWLSPALLGNTQKAREVFSLAALPDA